MTVHNAMVFIEKGLNDTSLRQRLNSASSRKEIQDVLADDQMIFADNEFDDAFYTLLTQCQTAEKADQLREFKMWWNFLYQMVDPQSTGCGHGCTACGA